MVKCQRLEMRQLEEQQTKKRHWANSDLQFSFFLLSLLYCIREGRLEKGKSRRDAQGNMGTGQGLGLRGSAPGGTVQTLFVWGGPGVGGQVGSGSDRGPGERDPS